MRRCRLDVHPPGKVRVKTIEKPGHLFVERKTKRRTRPGPIKGKQSGISTFESPLNHSAKCNQNKSRSLRAKLYTQAGESGSFQIIALFASLSWSSSSICCAAWAGSGASRI